MNNFKQQIINYYVRHLQSAFNSLGQLSRTPFATFMTCLIIGITLALPTILFVVLKNIEALRGNIQQTTQITLYLKNNIEEKEARNLTNALAHKAIIQKAYAISPEAGLRELQKNAGFQDVLEELTDNPLPWVIVLDPNIKNDNTRDLNQLIQTLKQLPAVDNVQADMLWVKRFGTFVMLIKRGITALAILLGAAVLLIVNNTIRSATLKSQKEIEIIKLIGGTNAFIRRPFLYAGIFYGLLGSIIACVLVMLLLQTLAHPAKHFASLFNSDFNLLGLGFSATLSLLISGVLLGLLGASIAVKTPLK